MIWRNHEQLAGKFVRSVDVHMPVHRVHERGWMVQRGSGRRTDLLQEEAMNGCTVSGGTKIMATSWVSVSLTALLGSMIRDEQSIPLPSLSWGLGDI